MSRIDGEELGDRGALLPSPQAFAAAYEAVPEALLCNEAVTDAASYSELFQGFVFPTYGTWEEGGTKSLLRERVLQGASHRYRSVDEKVLQRIDYELAIIKDKGFCDYFLTVQDIAQKASCTCGRGSAAASIVSYCLGITDVDPLRHNLYFDRFLNPGRVDPPDIDVDFAWDERDALLNAVIEQYGPEHAARVANHVCFQRQAACGKLREHLVFLTLRFLPLKDGKRLVPRSRKLRSMPHGPQLPSLRLGWRAYRATSAYIPAGSSLCLTTL